MSKMSFATINPTNEKMLKEYDGHTEKQILDLIESTNIRFEKWRKTSFGERSELLMKIEEILLKNKNVYAKTMALEMGKPFAQGIAELEKSAWVCRYYAENAEQQLRDQEYESNGSRSYVSFQPIGPIFCIMPWNFPFWQVFRFVAPATMAGNTVVLKHSPNTTEAGIQIEEIFREAGYPDNVLTNLIIDPKDVAELSSKVIESPYIHGVTLTGSNLSGAKVAEKAGSLLKKSVLELGGSDPYIVLEDADLENAANKCITARMLNAGQTCIAAKRFIVVESVHDDFLDLCIEKTEKIKIGDPLADGIDMGPLARKDLQLNLHRQVVDSIAMKAKLHIGGVLPNSKGFFYIPTILSNVKKGMPVFDEEVFGPVASIIKVNDEQQAIEAANDTSYGLGAAVFTSDIERGNRIARNEIQAGACFVNNFVKSDPRLPFGGIKESGYGRELSEYGIKEFVNIKTISIG
jgi:succinate-semialdehyde dehydrogenase / glutarate-semialdehyde dehydrogenase